MVFHINIGRKISICRWENNTYFVKKIVLFVVKKLKGAFITNNMVLQWYSSSPQSDNRRHLEFQYFTINSHWKFENDTNILVAVRRR